MEKLSTESAPAIGRFLRSVSRACLELAEDLESMSGRAVQSGSIEELGLGSLQLQIARGLSNAADVGVSPRELTALIERHDEPNVRTALQALERRALHWWRGR